MELQSAHQTGYHQYQPSDGKRHWERSAGRRVTGESIGEDIYAVRAVGVVASRTAISLTDAERVQEEIAGLAAEADICTRAGVTAISGAGSALPIQYISICGWTSRDTLPVVKEESTSAARTVRERDARRTVA